MGTTLSRLCTAALAAAALLVAPLSTSTEAAASVIYVATNGKDSASGSSRAPVRTIQEAVRRAEPGTTIKIRQGTYSGQVRLNKSGRAGKPITLTNAGDGEVQLTSKQRTVACSASSPATNRTIMVVAGNDHWNIHGLTIHNGVTISGREAHSAFLWHKKLVNAKDVASRRAAPGRGSDAPAAADNITTYLRKKTGKKKLDPAEHISLRNNVITGRGIHANFARKGEVVNNTIKDIDCGTGPGIWLLTFSDKWTVNNNTISKIAPSSHKHFMQEGIRLGSASNYNVISNNTIKDLPGDGWGINTDVDSSYNTIRDNDVRNVSIGYADQMAGWGNEWVGNEVRQYRTYGYALRLMDSTLKSPSKHSSAWGTTLRCNYAAPATGKAKALGVGGLSNATFRDNNMTSAWISGNARNYWKKSATTWDGKTSAPTSTTITPSAAARKCADG